MNNLYIIIIDFTELYYKRFCRIVDLRILILPSQKYNPPISCRLLSVVSTTILI